MLGSSNQSLVSDRLVENEPVFSRREFLSMTAASLLIARSLSASAAAEAKNGIPHRTLGLTGEKVSLVARWVSSGETERSSREYSNY